MSKKGSDYMPPRKLVKIPADILALGKQGEAIAHSIFSHYDNRRRDIEQRSNFKKTL